MSTKLTQEQVQKNLAKLSSWSLNEKGEITRKVRVKDFARALLLVNSVGLQAEMMNHHPDILIQYNQITFSLITHDAGGLTQNDFDLAAKVDAISA